MQLLLEPRQRPAEPSDVLCRPSGGFYYMDTGGIKLASLAHLAVVTVLPEQDLAPSVVISAEAIRVELAGLERGWSWVVREISPTEFVVSFPTAQLLTHLSWSPTITLPIHNIRVSLRPSASNPDAPPPLLWSGSRSIGSHLSCRRGWTS